MSVRAEKQLSGAKVSLGSVRKRFFEAIRKIWLRPKIRAAANPALRQVRTLRRSLRRETPLVGILLGEHFGDIVAIEPLVRYLRRMEPRSHILFFTKPAYAEMVAAHPEINGVVILNSISEAEVIVKSGVLDTAVDLHLEGKPCGRYGRNYRKRSGNRTYTPENYFHFGSLLEVFSQSAGLPRLNEPPRMFIPNTVKAQVDALKLKDGFIVIHASSNEAARNWTTARWNELVDELRRIHDATVVEIGLAPVLTPGRPGCIDLCGKLSLLETAEVIRRAEVFIGVESGPAHFANAFQRPSVILMGKYRDFENRMPYTGFFREENKMLLRWPEPSPEIPVSAVIKRFEQVLAGGTRAPFPAPVAELMDSPSSEVIPRSPAEH